MKSQDKKNRIKIDGTEIEVTEETKKAGIR